MFVTLEGTARCWLMVGSKMAIRDSGYGNGG